MNADAAGCVGVNKLPVGLGTGRREHWGRGQGDVWTAQAGQGLCGSAWNLQAALWGLEAETVRGVFIMFMHVHTHTRSHRLNADCGLIEHLVRLMLVYRPFILC